MVSLLSSDTKEATKSAHRRARAVWSQSFHPCRPGYHAARNETLS